MFKPAQEPMAVEFMTAVLQAGGRRACRLIRLARPACRYQRRANGYIALRIILKAPTASSIETRPRECNAG